MYQGFLISSFWNSVQGSNLSVSQAKILLEREGLLKIKAVTFKGCQEVGKTIEIEKNFDFLYRNCFAVEKEDTVHGYVNMVSFLDQK